MAQADGAGCAYGTLMATGARGTTGSTAVDQTGIETNGGTSRTASGSNHSPCAMEGLPGRRVAIHATPARPIEIASLLAPIWRITSVIRLPFDSMSPFHDDMS